MSERSTDLVLVVGAGPTGLAAAMELSRLGVRVRLVDRLAAPVPTSRAIGLQARTLELLDARGPAAEMLRLGHRAHAAAVHGDGRLLGKVRLDEIRSRHNYILLLPQSDTERLLAAQCERQGVVAERSTELVAIARHVAAGGHAPDSVTAILRHADGALESVDAAYVIAAEGAHSLLRHTFDLPFEGRSLPQHYALGDLHVDGGLPEDELSIYAGERGFLAMFPLGARRFRLIATDAEAPADGRAPTLAELQALYDRDATAPARLHDLTWSSRFHIESRMLSRLRVGPVFFGGDTAHVHSPAGGQGMNTGIQDMIGLGWKLAWVLQGRASPELLDTHEPERLAVVRGIVSKTEKATEVINAGDSILHTLFTRLAPLMLKSDLVQETATALIGELSAHYRDSPLSDNHRRHDELQAGDRVPDPLVTCSWLSDGARVEPLQALLDPSRLTLLVTGPDAASHVPALATRFAPWLPLMDLRALAPADPTPAGQDAFTTLFGREPGLRVVRPDGYVGYAGDLNDLPALARWLQRWFPV